MQLPDPNAVTNQQILQDAHDLSVGTLAAYSAGRDIHVHLENGGEIVVDEVVKIAAWLSPVNYRQYHNETTSLRTANTGMWFLEGPEFQQWLESRSGTLWVTGMPGAGKTVLSSIAIDQLRLSALQEGNSDTAVVFAYCRYTDSCTSKMLLRTFIKQLIEAQPRVYPILKAIYDKCRAAQTQLTESEATALLRTLVPLFENVQVVIDGLDEIPDDEKTKILTTLGSLPIHALIFSRPLDLFVELLPLAATLSIEARNEDIELFVITSIKTNARLRRLLAAREDTIQEIATKIKHKSEGMFLVASLQVEALKSCMNPTSLRTVVDSLPSGVDAMYHRTLERIDDQTEEESSLAKLALLWVAHACRPLSVTELQDALATPHTTRTFDTDATTPSDIILSVCCGLVVVEEETSRVRLIHYTAQDFIRNLPSSPFSEFGVIATTVCITHYLHHQSEATKEFGNYSQITRSFTPSFLSYADRYWGVHAKDVTSPQLAVNFLERRIAMTLPREHPLVASSIYPPEEQQDAYNACHLIAFFGLSQSLPLVKHGHEISPVRRWNALHLAVYMNQEEMVELLLDPSSFPSFDINAQDSLGNAALHMAVYHNHKSIVQILLNHPSIDPNRRNGFGTVALLIAIELRLTDIAVLLIQHPSIDVNASNHFGQSALHTLILYRPSTRRSDVVQLLLAHPSVNVNLADHSGQVLLTTAFYAREQQEIVNLIISHPHLNVNYVDDKGFTPLTLALQHGFRDAVQTLVSRSDIDVNLNAHSPQNLYGHSTSFTPLVYAAWLGLDWGAKILLSHPHIDVNAGTSDGYTPLMAACCYGHAGIVQMLLAHPHVDVGACSVAKETALSWAAGWEAYIEVSPHDQPAVSLDGRVAAAKLLVAHPNLYPDTRCLVTGTTPIMVASLLGCASVVQNLISPTRLPSVGTLSERINARDYLGDSALILACRGGHQHVVKMLLLHEGIDVNVQNNAGQTALLEAQENGDDEIVDLLLSHPSIDFLTQHDASTTEVLAPVLASSGDLSGGSPPMASLLSMLAADA